MKRSTALLVGLTLVVTAAIVSYRPSPVRAGAENIFLQGYKNFLKPGDTQYIYAKGFFPRYLCKKKIKFHLWDGKGKKYYLGSKATEAEGIFTSKSGPFAAHVPAGVAPGRGKIRGRQNCGDILGTASDTDKVKIGGTGPPPDLTSSRVEGGLAGQKTTLLLDLDITPWRATFLTVRLEMEFLPDQWQEVTTLVRDQLLYQPGGYEAPWSSRIDGKPAQPGRYRFVMDFYRDEFQQGGIEATFTEEFNLAHQLPGGLSFPVDGELDKDGNLLVADQFNDRLAVYSQDGEFLRTIGGLQDPKDVGVAPDGKMYVANSESDDVRGSGEIVVLDPNGTEITRFAEFGFSHRADGPVGIAVTPLNGGRVYVVDASASPCVSVFDLTGNDLADIDDANCSGPLDVAVAPDGTVWVADKDNEAALHYSAAGAFLGKADNVIPGPLVTTLGEHETVDVTAAGHLLVGAHDILNPSSSGIPGIFEFDADGHFLRTLDSKLVTDPTGVTAAGLAGDFYVVQEGPGTVLHLRRP